MAFQLQPESITYDSLHFPGPKQLILVDDQNGLEGLKIGKFFSRAFHWKGIRRKLPRMAVGAGTALVLGGHGGSVWKGALTGAAGAVAAAIPKRKAGASFLKDLGVGIGMGAIPGIAIGTYRGLTSPATRSLAEVGVAGKTAQAIQRKFFPQAYQRLNPQAQLVKKKPIPTEELLRPAKRQEVVTEGKVSTGESLWKTTGEVIKAASPLALSILAQQGSIPSEMISGGMPISGQTIPGGEAYYLPQSIPQEQAQFIEPGALVEEPIAPGGGMFGETFGGGGGGGLIPVQDPETGEIQYVPAPTFWQKYKLPLIAGGVFILTTFAVYNMSKR